MDNLDPHRELATLAAQIAPPEARRRELITLLDGPRVTPVLVSWRQGQRYEDDCPSVAVAFALANEMVENGTGWGEHVLIGGAVLTEDEWEAAGRG